MRIMKAVNNHISILVNMLKLTIYMFWNSLLVAVELNNCISLITLVIYVLFCNYCEFLFNETCSVKTEKVCGTTWNPANSLAMC